MRTYIFPALKLSFLCLIFFSILYPLSVWAVAQLAPNRGRGEEVIVNGRTVGFKLIGQAFKEDKYFTPRPSAVAFNAASSGGSNKSAANPDYLKDVQAKIDTFLAHNPGVTKVQIPSELVTASGSGLDPDLSPQGALIQVPRIAKIRGLSAEKINALVESQLSKPLIGTATVNVLGLNIALDKLK